MTGKEYRLQLEAYGLQEKAEQPIIEFLDRHLQTGLIFDEIRNTESWLEEIYPKIMDEDERDEELISAFIAGFLHVLINTPGTGIRWIHLQPAEDEDE